MTNNPQFVKYVKDKNFIIANLNLKPDIAFFLDVFGDVMDLSESNNCFNILIDAAKVEKLPSLTTIYDIVKFEIKYFDWFKTTRRAYVIPEKIENSFSRYSSILKNRGVRTKIFRTKNDAIDWLVEDG